MPKRYAIQVVESRTGAVMYLRHGHRPGHGYVVTFATRKLADINCEMVGMGLDDSQHAQVVEWTKRAAPTPKE